MKKLKSLLFLIIPVIVVIIAMFLFVNIFNSDLYGRLTETATIKSSSSDSNDEPTLTLILHKYLNEESSIEASIVVNAERSSMFERFGEKIKIIAHITDGYNYDPTGVINQVILTDSIQHDSYGHLFFAAQSNRFLIPVAPSSNGFPYDDIIIRPMVDLYINNRYNDFKFDVQKRIPGKILNLTDNNENVELTRTPTEKYFVMISSVIFLLVTFLLTYGLIKSKEGLSRVEELIAVASYLIAIAGFRELIGITRDNGSSTLEIVVILVPLLCIFTGILYSFFKAKKQL